MRVASQRTYITHAFFDERRIDYLAYAQYRFKYSYLREYEPEVSKCSIESNINNSKHWALFFSTTYVVQEAMENFVFPDEMVTK